MIDHPGTLEALYATIGCTTVQAIGLTEGEMLWCDEEALLRDDPGPFFQLHASTPIAGKAVALGEVDGEIVDCGLRVDLIWNAISFPDIKLVGWSELDGSQIVETPLGPMPVIGREPIFAPRQVN